MIQATGDRRVIGPIFIFIVNKLGQFVFHPNVSHLGFENYPKNMASFKSRIMHNEVFVTAHIGKF